MKTLKQNIVTDVWGWNGEKIQEIIMYKSQTKLQFKPVKTENFEEN